MTGYELLSKTSQGIQFILCRSYSTRNSMDQLKKKEAPLVMSEKIMDSGPSSFPLATFGGEINRNFDVRKTMEI